MTSTPATTATAPTTDAVLVLSCPDQRGIVAAVSALLFDHGANIEESQQFDDVRTDQFFMRIRFSVSAGGPDVGRWRELFADVAARFDMQWQIRGVADPYRALIMVSRFGHCLNDLLFRWRSGALTMDIPADLVVLARYMQVLSDRPGTPTCPGGSSTSTTRSCRRSRAASPTTRPSSAA
jgi:formyltetrahydrofolate hydrolase